jgi:hypothetical protein
VISYSSLLSREDRRFTADGCPLTVFAQAHGES